MTMFERWMMRFAFVLGIIGLCLTLNSFLKTDDIKYIFMLLFGSFMVSWFWLGVSVGNK